MTARTGMSISIHGIKYVATLHGRFVHDTWIRENTARPEQQATQERAFEIQQGKEGMLVEIAMPPAYYVYCTV